MIDFDSLERCDSFFSKFKGLMFSKRRNLLFDLGDERFAWIHTFFVFFPIKVYWLNSSKEIIDYKIVKPFRLGIPKCRARYIVEISKK
jgi:uncharacterized membrane protein (UPF0127 family)